MEACPLPKHKTQFERNAVKTVRTQGPLRGTLMSSVVGVYKCVACEYRRIGKSNPKADWPQL